MFTEVKNQASWELFSIDFMLRLLFDTRGGAPLWQLERMQLQVAIGLVFGAVGLILKLCDGNGM